jgi:hypothetical protein
MPSATCRFFTRIVERQPHLRFIMDDMELSTEITRANTRKCLPVRASMNARNVEGRRSTEREANSTPGVRPPWRRPRPFGGHLAGRGRLAVCLDQTRSRPLATICPCAGKQEYVPC